MHHSISSPESSFPSDTWCWPKGSQSLGTRLYTDWSHWLQLVVDSHKLLLVTSEQQTTNSGYHRQSTCLNMTKQGAHIHQPTAWLVPDACAQPYHLGSDIHGQRFRPYWGSSAWQNRRSYGQLFRPYCGSSLWHSRQISVRTKPYWWAPIRTKQLAMATTARVIWLCACVRYWPGRGLVNVYPLL